MGLNDAQREFANDSAQGIYNATLALIDYDQDPRSSTVYAPAVPNSPFPPPLLGYGMPEAPCLGHCRPPVWVSVVGRTTVLPLRAFADLGDYSGTIMTGPYVLEVSPWKVDAKDPKGFDSGPAALDVASAGRAAPFPSPALDAAFLVLSITILSYWAFTRRVRRRLDDSLGRHGHRRQLAGLLCTPKARGRGSFLAAVFGVLLVETFAVVLCIARVRVDHWSPWSLGASALVLACLAALADMTLPVARRFVTDDLTRRRLLNPERFGWRRPATWAGAGIVVLVATSVVCLLAYEASLVAAVIDEAPVAIGLIARAADPRSGVCPTLPIAMLGAAITLWGVLELARLRSPHVALGESGVYPLVRQMVHGHIDSLAADWRLLDRSIMTVPARFGACAALAAAATAIFSFDPWVRSLTTVEGPWFGHFASATLLLVQVMISLALLQFVCLWTSLRRLLERMTWHPMASAFDRVPRELFPKSLLVRVPKLMELQRLVADCGSSATPAVAEKLDQSFRWDMKQSPLPKWSASDTWRMLLQRATAASPVAPGSPTGVVGVAAATGGAPIAADTPPVDAPKAHSGEGRNELAAMAMTLVIRDALARFGYNLTFVIGAILLMFGSHVLFPYRQRQRLAALDWIFIAFTFAAIVVVLAQMKRNDIIGRLAAANPGERATWDAEFVLKLTVFGLLPLLTLFAAQFPEIGGTLLHWLEPVEKVLP